MNEENIIKLSKKGGFYYVYKNDCYIIYYLLHYKILNNKLGFPVSAISKVTNILENKHINYYISENEKQEYVDNNYAKYLNLGKVKYTKEEMKKSIFEKINLLSIRQTDELLNIIKEYLDEQQI